MMPKSELWKEALALPAPERVALAVELWDSLAPEEVPVPDWQLDLIDERLAELEDIPPAERSEPWEVVRERIFSDGS